MLSQNLELLRFIARQQPSEAALVDWLGGISRAGSYHRLRKAGIVRIQDERVTLSQQHHRAESDTILYGNERLHLDTGLCDIF